MDARGKFEEHEKCVRVARGAAESNSSFLSALLIPKCIHNSTYAQLKAWASDKVQNSHNAQKKSKQTSLLAGQNHATFYTLVWATTFDPFNR